MALYTLNGAGVQGITPGTTRLFIEVIVFPHGYSTGRAAPPNYYGIGLIRPGVQGAYAPAIPIDAHDTFIDLPDGCDSFGYDVFSPGTIGVNESFPLPPAGSTLSVTSPDVPPHNGSTVTISWSGVPGVLADDYVLICPTTLPSGTFDGSVSCFGGLGFAFAATCGGGPDGSLPSDPGSCTNIIFDHVGTGTACNARYRRNADDSDVLISATFVMG